MQDRIGDSGVALAGGSHRITAVRKLRSGRTDTAPAFASNLARSRVACLVVEVRGGN